MEFMPKKLTRHLWASPESMPAQNLLDKAAQTGKCFAMFDQANVYKRYAFVKMIDNSSFWHSVKFNVMFIKRMLSSKWLTIFSFWQCQIIANQGFKRGSYICMCKRGYYFPEPRAPFKAFNGTLIELEHDRKLRGEPNSYEDSFECVRCSIGCDHCIDDSPCLYSRKIVIRLTLCVLNGAIMGVTVAFAVYVGLHWQDRVCDRYFL